MNIRQRKSERHKEALRSLSQEGENKVCFDCGVRGPLYIVSDFGILVCSGCSAVHRSFQHKVKGITMSEFTDEEIACFAACGNDRAKSVWLSSFRGNLPRSGDVVALKDHVRATFVERRYWDAQEYTALHEALTHANEPQQSAPVSRPAAVTLAPPPSSAVRAAPNTLTVARPGETLTKQPPAPAPPPAQPHAQPTSVPPVPPVDLLDSLFAAPAQSLPLPPPPPATSTLAPTTAPQAQRTAASMVDDFFASASLSEGGAPGGGSGAPSMFSQPVHQQQQGLWMGCPDVNQTHAPTQSFTQYATTPPLNQMQHGMWNPQQHPCPESSATPGQRRLENAQSFNPSGPFVPSVAPAQPAPLPSQQQPPFSWGQPPPSAQPLPQGNGMINGLSFGAPVSSSGSTTAMPQNFFSSGAPDNTFFPTMGGSAPSSFQAAAFPVANPPLPSAQEGGWGTPSTAASTGAPTGNQSRIVVLSVSRPPNGYTDNSQNLWP